MTTSRSRTRPQATTGRFGFAFLDETGTLGAARDPFFAVGLIKCSDPYKLQRPMQRIRDRHHFYDEVKWNKTSAKKLPLMIELLNVFFASDATFTAFIADKSKHDVIGSFGNQFSAYEALARQLVRASVRRGETLWVIADEYSTPPAETFEETVRDYVNAQLGRTAVAGVCRMRSSGIDLLQLIDLLLGAVVYEHKAAAGVVTLTGYKPKVKLLEHVKARGGVATFVGGYRDTKLNVAEYVGKKTKAAP